MKPSRAESRWRERQAREEARHVSQEAIEDEASLVIAEADILKIKAALKRQAATGDLQAAREYRAGLDQFPAACRI